MSDSKFTRFPVAASVGERSNYGQKAHEVGKKRSKMEKDGRIEAKDGENLFLQILMLIRPNGEALLCFFRQLIACVQSEWIFQTELNQSAVFWN